MMLLKPILSLSRRMNMMTFVRVVAAKHTPTCPSGKGGGGSGGHTLLRAEKSAPCRLVFLPEEWFQFFHVKTGVTGFYMFLLVLGNYCFSKEVLVIEHEYYTGLSLLIMTWYATTRGGPKLAASLDKQVDELTESYYVGRKQEIAANEALIADAQLAQKQALGQEMLMAAKKENILMQLEAIYRERAMLVYTTVLRRLEYQRRLEATRGRIQQKWMIHWILQSVMKSITPDFEAAALNQAIKDIEEVASRA